jgi:hypothetical protein
LVCELAREMKPARVRNRATCLARPEDEVSEPPRARNSEFFSVSPEPIVNEPARDLKSEFFTWKLETGLTDPASDLNNEDRPARFKDPPSKATKPLPIPLAMEPPKLSVSLSVLKKEVCLARLEAVFKFPAKVVEHERGLELQASFPESTLAARLPVVIVIEPVRALKTEFFSPSVEPRFSESLRALNSEFFPRRFEAEASKALKDRRNDVC